MEEVDENEGYYSENEQEEEFKESNSKPAPVIKFLNDDEIQPFSLGSIKSKAAEKDPVVASKKPEIEEVPIFWHGNSKASSKVAMTVADKPKHRRYIYQEEPIKPQPTETSSENEPEIDDLMKLLSLKSSALG